MIFRKAKAAEPEAPEVRARALLARVRGSDEGDLSTHLDALLAALADESPRVRAAGLEGLGHLGLHNAPMPETVGARVLERTRDEIPAVRAEAASTLALLPGATCPRRIPALLELLEDEVASVREEAAAALGDVREDRPFAARPEDALAERLEDPAVGVRFESAYALAVRGDARGRDVLIDALEEPRWRVLAADRLGLLGDEVARPRLAELADRRFLHWADKLHVLGALYRLGDPSAGPKIVARARAFGRLQREYALWVIGTVGVRDGVPLLAELARSTGHRLREAAIRALGALESPLAAELLLEVALDARAPLELRVEATRRLSEKPSGERHAALARLSETNEDALREAALEGLAELRARPAPEGDASPAPRATRARPPG